MIIFLGLTWIVGMYLIITGDFSSVIIFLPSFLSRSAFNSPANKAVVSRLVTEVRSLNPSYQASIIKGK